MTAVAMLLRSHRGNVVWAAIISEVFHLKNCSITNRNIFFDFGEGSIHFGERTQSVNKYLSINKFRNEERMEPIKFANGSV
jgi:hypothetical protein